MSASRAGSPKWWGVGWVVWLSPHTRAPRPRPSLSLPSPSLWQWSEIAERTPGRVSKQCRERWFNHLDPSLKKGDWEPEEDAVLVEAQKQWGNAWTKIAKLIEGRSENAVKNRWNSATDPSAAT